MATQTNGNGTHADKGLLRRVWDTWFDVPAPAPAPAPAAVPVEPPPVKRQRARRWDSLAAQLKSTRTARHLTQAAAAVQLQTTLDRYQTWERGTTRPGETQRRRVVAWLADPAATTPPDAPAPDSVPAGWLPLAEAAPLYGCTLGQLQHRVYRQRIAAVRGPSKYGPAKWYVPPPGDIGAPAPTPTLAPPPVDKAALVAPLPADTLAAPGTRAIGALLAAWQAARGVTLADLSRASRIREETLIAYTHDRQRAAVVQQRALAAALGVDLAAFLAGPNAAPPPPPEPTDQLVIIYGNHPPVVGACTARDFDTLVALVQERTAAR